MMMMAALAAFLCSGASAQGWLGKLKDKAVDKVKEKVENKVEDQVGSAADDVLSGTTKTSKKSDSREETETEVPQQTEPVKKTKTAKGEERKSDFVPGTAVIFEDNLQGERLGEFPSKWDLLSNNAEVAKMNGKMAIKFEHGSDTEITPLLKDGNKKYLPEVYTLEFDFFGGSNASYTVRLTSEDNEVANTVWFNPERMYWTVTKPNSTDYVEGNAPIEDVMEQNAWNHFALSFNKRALKVYVNNKRIINIPNARAMDWFVLKTDFWEDHVDYVTNVRLAKGGVELYDRNAQSMTPIEKAIAETGKFVTNNILFETGKATLKPESMTEIQKVADYMKKNPRVRFEVQGHTDNQGSDKINDPLSQQRAEAVVKALEGLGCDAFNLRPVGKGSHEPVADNKTEAGRAKNRRVEFIKK